MFDFINPLIIVGLILSFVILFNVALIIRWKHRPKGDENQALQAMLKTIKTPWKDEDQALNELAALVKNAQNNPSEETEDSNIRNQNPESSK